MKSQFELIYFLSGNLKDIHIKFGSIVSGFKLLACRLHTSVAYFTEVNSLAPGKFEWNFRHVIFKPIFVIDGWGMSCETALIWMSLDFTDD